MALEITNLCRSLRSEKETERRKAMKNLNENWLAQSTSKSSPLRVEIWDTLICASIFADTKEIENSVSKRKPPKTDFALFLVKCVRLAESSHANFLCYGSDPRQQDGITSLGSSSRSYGILAPHVVGLINKICNAFDDDELFELLCGPDCYGSILKHVLSSPYYLTLISPSRYQSLAKQLCELIMGAKAGIFTHQLALALKLLFQNGSYDLHTLLGAAFHFFGQWCEAQTSANGSYGATTLDESVLHIFGTINILLARYGLATATQLFSHGDKILRFVLPQLNASASRKDLHASFLEYLCRHMAIAGASPHGGFDLDLDDPIASRVGSLCRALLGDRELSALSNRLGNPLDSSLYKGGGLVAHQLGVADARLSGFDNDGLPMFLNNSLNGSQWDPATCAVPGVGCARELDARARLHLNLLARLIVHSSTQYSEAAAPMTQAENASPPTPSSSSSSAVGSANFGGNYWLWLKTSLLQAIEIDTAMANEVKPSHASLSSGTTTALSLLAGRSSSGGGVSSRSSSSGHGTRHKRLRAGAPPSQPLKSTSYLMLLVTVLEMYPNGEAWMNILKKEQSNLRNDSLKSNLKLKLLSMHFTELVELLQLLVNILGGLALAVKLQLHDGFAPTLQLWSLIGLSQLVKMSKTAMTSFKQMVSSSYSQSSSSSSSSSSTCSIQIELEMKSKQMISLWDGLCWNILFRKEAVYWRSLNHAGDHLGEVMLALLAQLIACDLVSQKSSLHCLSLPCFVYNDDVGLVTKDESSIPAPNQDLPTQGNSPSYAESGYRLLDRDRVPPVSVLELSRVLVSNYLKVSQQASIDFLTLETDHEEELINDSAPTQTVNNQTDVALDVFFSVPVEGHISSVFGFLIASLPSCICNASAPALAATPSFLLGLNAALWSTTASGSSSTTTMSPLNGSLNGSLDGSIDLLDSDSLSRCLREPSLLHSFTPSEQTNHSALSSVAEHEKSIPNLIVMSSLLRKVNDMLIDFNVDIGNLCNRPNGESVELVSLFSLLFSVARLTHLLTLLRDGPLEYMKQIGPSSSSYGSSIRLLCYDESEEVQRQHRFLNVLDEWDSVITKGLELICIGMRHFELDDDFGLYCSCMSANNDATLSPLPFFESLAALVGSVSAIEVNSYACSLPLKAPPRMLSPYSSKPAHQSNLNSYMQGTYEMDVDNEEAEIEDEDEDHPVNDTSWRVSRKGDLRGRLKKACFKLVDALQAKMEKFNNARDSYNPSTVAHTKITQNSSSQARGGPNSQSGFVGGRSQLKRAKSLMDDTDSEDEEDERNYRPNFQTKFSDEEEEGADDGFSDFGDDNNKKRYRSRPKVNVVKKKRGNVDNEGWSSNSPFASNDISSEMSNWLSKPFTRAVHEVSQIIALALARGCFYDKYKDNKTLCIRAYGGDGKNTELLTGRISGTSGLPFARYSATERLDMLKTVACFANSPLYMQRAAADARRGDRSGYEWIITSVQTALLGGPSNPPGGASLSIYLDILIHLIQFSASSAASMKGFKPYHESIPHLQASISAIFKVKQSRHHLSSKKRSQFSSRLTLSEVAQIHTLIFLQEQNQDEQCEFTKTIKNISQPQADKLKKWISGHSIVRRKQLLASKQLFHYYGGAWATNVANLALNAEAIDSLASESLQVDLKRAASVVKSININLMFRTMVTERLNDVDDTIRNDAIGAACLLLFHYKPDSHEKIYEHVVSCLPPLPETNDMIKRAYFCFSEVSSPSTQNSNESQLRGGHGYFTSASHTFIIPRPTSWNFRQLFESTALSCRASLAIAAARAHLSITHAKHVSSGGCTINNTKQPGGAFDRNQYYMELGDSFAYPNITLSCLSEFMLLAVDRPDLEFSLCRLIAQINTSFGFPTQDEGAVLRDPPVLVHLLTNWILVNRRDAATFPFHLLLLENLKQNETHSNEESLFYESLNTIFVPSVSQTGGVERNDDDHFELRHHLTSEEDTKQVAYFLSWCSPWLMPIVSRLPPDERFREYETIANLLGYGEGDRGMSQLLVRSFQSVKTEELILSYAAQDLGECHMSHLLSVSARDVCDFSLNLLGQKLQSSTLRRSKDKLIYSILRRGLVPQVFCSDDNVLSSAPNDLSIVHKALAGLALGCHKSLNDFLVAENTPEILLRLYCALRTSATVHGRTRLAGMLRLMFLANIPANNCDVEANATDWNAYSQNMDSESQHFGGSSCSSGSGKRNIDLKESIGRVMLHICISLLREENLSGGGGGGFLSEMSLYFVVVHMLSTLTGICLEPANQVAKDVDADFLGKHLELVVQTLLDFLQRLHTIARKLRSHRSHFRQLCAGLKPTILSSSHTFSSSSSPSLRSSALYGLDTPTNISENLSRRSGGLGTNCATYLNGNSDYKFNECPLAQCPVSAIVNSRGCFSLFSFSHLSSPSFNLDLTKNISVDPIAMELESPMIVHNINGDQTRLYDNNENIFSKYRNKSNRYGSVEDDIDYDEEDQELFVPYGDSEAPSYSAQRSSKRNRTDKKESSSSKNQDALFEQEDWQSYKSPSLVSLRCLESTIFELLKTLVGHQFMEKHLWRLGSIHISSEMNYDKEEEEDIDDDEEDFKLHGHILFECQKMLDEVHLNNDKQTVDQYKQNVMQQQKQNSLPDLKRSSFTRSSSSSRLCSLRKQHSLKETLSVNHDMFNRFEIASSIFSESVFRSKSIKTSIRKEHKRYHFIPLGPTSLRARYWLKTVQDLRTQLKQYIYQTKNEDAPSSSVSSSLISRSAGLVREEVLDCLRGALLAVVAGLDSGLNDYDVPEDMSTTKSSLSSSHSTGAELRHEAALLLGEIGTPKMPERSSIVPRWQHTHSVLSQMYHMDEDCSGGNEDNEEEDGEDGEETGQNVSIQAQALTMICEALLDPEPRIVLVSMEAVKLLLANADGQTAHHSKDCNRDVYRLLQPFRDSKHIPLHLHHQYDANYCVVKEQSFGYHLHQQANPIPSSNDRNHRLVEFTSKKLWAPVVSSGYGDWICNLTSRLLSDCYADDSVLQPSSSSLLNGSSLLHRKSVSGVNDDILSKLKGHDLFLKFCLPLCSLRPNFAELLFPAIIDDLTCQTDHSARKLISDCITDHLLDCESSNRSHLRAMKLVIQTVNMLRTRLLTTFRDAIPPKTAKMMKSSKSSKSSSSLLSQSGYSKQGLASGLKIKPHDDERRSKDRVLPWGLESLDTLLDLDLLKLAKAAAHCGCYCSAILYAEWACEHYFTTPAFALKDDGVEEFVGFEDKSMKGKNNEEEETVVFQKDRTVQRTYGSSSTSLLRSARTTSNNNSEKNGWNRARGNELRCVLLKAYHCLGQDDYVHALRGLSSSYGGGSESQDLVYLDSADSLQLLTHCDAALQSSSTIESSTRFDMFSHSAAALKRLGLMHVASSYLHSLHVRELDPCSVSSSGSDVGHEFIRRNDELENNIKKLKTERYASAWRAMEWDVQLNSTHTANSNSSASTNYSTSALSFDQAVHGALKAASANNTTVMHHCLERGRMDVLRRIASFAREESNRQIFPAVLELQALNEISEASALFFTPFLSRSLAASTTSSSAPKTYSQSDRINLLLSTWTQRLEPLLLEPISFIEPLLSVREIALNLALENNSKTYKSSSLSVMSPSIHQQDDSVNEVVSIDSALKHALSDHLFTIVGLCRDSGKPSSGMVPLRKLSALLLQQEQSSQSIALDGACIVGGFDRKQFLQFGRLKIEEARVLWSVGETDLAMKNLKTLVATISRHSSSSLVRHQNNQMFREEEEEGRDGNEVELLALHRDVLTLLGEWAAHTRSSGSDEVVDFCLKPAVHIADDITLSTNSSQALEAQAATHLKLADFLSQLYVSLKSRLSSAEWASTRRVAKHRKKEYDSCVERDKELKNRIEKARTQLSKTSPNQNRRGSQLSPASSSSSSTSGTLHPSQVEDVEDLKRELHALGRHKIILSREIAIDSAEHDRATQSANQYLIDCLDHYRHALVGGGAQLRTIFRVVKIWLDNSTNTLVNESMKKMVTQVPSYKWLPLTYQLSSRLGANPIDPRKQSLVQAGLKTTSAGIIAQSQLDTQDETLLMLSCATSNDITFAIVLEKLLWRICTEHPHQSIIQVFALAHGNSLFFESAKFGKANVDVARVDAANNLLHHLLVGEPPPDPTLANSTDNSLKKSSPQIRDLVIGLDLLVNGYLDLGRSKTEPFYNTPPPHRLKDLCDHQKFTTNPSLLKRHQSSSSMALGKKATHLVPFHQCLEKFMAAQQSKHGTKVSLVMPAVLTNTPKTSPVADYSHAIRIAGFDPHFSLTDTGLHRPAIIYCIGEDGKRYQQLVKGNDDVRQDMVMMQVFSAVNDFLSEEKREQSIQKRIRTYTVVPISPEVGVLEWVQDTIPIGNYLIDKNNKRGAHARYHPEDWTHSECRARMKEAKETGDSLALKSAYSEVCRNMKPAFRFFFLEYFAAGAKDTTSSKNANLNGSVNLARFTHAGTAEWYERRLSYCSSLAVSSMIGHIMGIGDRHTQNILVGTKTAEVVHIDFGVVFEQGKTLSTPEAVPFRLTRDMVDGLGITGVEGLFKNCCEDTLRCLRRPDNAAALNTLAEVFIYDPLYRWMLSPLQAIKRQRQTEGVKEENQQQINTTGGSGEEGNNASGIREAAERILTRIRQKLQGYEDPNDSALSVEGQVRLLIASATSEENLHKIFVGWAPWL